MCIISLQDPVKVGVVLSGGQVRTSEEMFLPMVSCTKHYEALCEALKDINKTVLACFQHDTFLSLLVPFSFIVFTILSIFKVAAFSNGSATRLLAATTSSLAFLMASRHGTRRVATRGSPRMLNTFENMFP